MDNKYNQLSKQIYFQLFKLKKIFYIILQKLFYRQL